MVERDPNCELCRLHKTAGRVCLLGHGPEPCEVMLVGEAPGYHEEQEGQAFVGKAGQLLRRLLLEVGLDPDELYITNAVNCRPPENRTPTAGEWKACRYWMDHQLHEVQPKFVLLLGNIPTKAALDTKKGIKKLRGKPVQKDGIWFLPTLHPAYILRDPNQKEALEADLRLLRDLIENDGPPQEEGLDFTVVDSWDRVEEMFNHLHGEVSLDIETTGLYPWVEGAKVTAVGLGTEDHQWCIPFEHWDYQPWSRAQLERIVARIDKQIHNCMVVAQNGKFDLLWMRLHYGVKWSIDFDTHLAHYILDENSRHSLEYMAQIYFGAIDYKIDAITVPWDELAEYLAKDLYYTRQLQPILAKKLDKEGDCKLVYDHILMPCVSMFTEAELTGVYVDQKQMRKAEKHLRAKLKKAKGTLDETAPGVNWRSPQQISKLLFEDLKIKPLDKTPKGAWSTNESVLKRLDHPVCRALLDHRNAAQKLSFFIDGWDPFLTDEGYIHPSVNLGGTVTGRPSYEHPNLQQTDRDPEIRSMIYAPPGWELVEADLSQLELRVAAELAREQTMLQVFYEGGDIHWSTAIGEISRGKGEILLVKRTAEEYTGRRLSYPDSVDTLLDMGPDLATQIDKEWKDLRRKAKAINFGFLYGMYPKGFRIYARDDYGLNISLEQAKQSRAAFFEMYPGLEDWHERVRRYVHQWGYVKSLSGRKRRLPAAQSIYDTNERRAAERYAINAPVQSFGSDLNLMAALQIHNEFDRRILRVLGTIHDSILMLIRTCMVRKAVPRVLEIMSHPALLDEMEIKLGVPIVAEAAIGPWSKGVDLETWCERKAA